MSERQQKVGRLEVGRRFLQAVPYVLCKAQRACQRYKARVRELLPAATRVAQAVRRAWGTAECARRVMQRLARAAVRGVKGAPKQAGAQVCAAR